MQILQSEHHHNLIQKTKSIWKQTCPNCWSYWMYLYLFNVFRKKYANKCTYVRHREVADFKISFLLRKYQWIVPLAFSLLAFKLRITEKLNHFILCISTLYPFVIAYLPSAHSKKKWRFNLFLPTFSNYFFQNLRN